MYELTDLSKKLAELEISWRKFGTPVSRKVKFECDSKFFELSFRNGDISLTGDWGVNIISKKGRIMDESYLTPQMFRKLAENLQYLKETSTGEVPKDLIDTIDRLK